MKPTEVQNLREAYMNEVWGDALNSRQKEKGLPKPGGPQPKSKRSAAGDEGTLGDALGARLTATPPKRSKKDDKSKEDKPKTDTRTRWQKRRDARRSSSAAARANTNDQGQSIKTDKPVVKKKDKETVAPRKSAPSGASDPRNAEYIKKRSAIAKAKSPEDKAKATKDAESAGKKAWAKANPAAAAAEKKRKASKNPLMKGFGDRDARKKELERIRGGAALKSIGSSKNADKILSGRSASKDAESTAKKSYNRVLTGNPNKGLDKPKTDAPKADAPKKDAAPKAAAPKNAGPGGYQTPAAATPKSTSAAKVSSTSSAPSKAVTPPPSAKPSQPGAPIVATAKQFSKGGKYRRESLMSFGAYQLSEKKTSVKINPKLKDLEEDLLNEGSCSGHSEGGEIVNGRCSICGGTPKKSTKKEETAYVSQEEVSEESYQEGYETETDLTEEQLNEFRGSAPGGSSGPLPGSIEAKKGSTYDSKKDFKQAYKANPGAFKSALPGGMGMMRRGRPGQYAPGSPQAQGMPLPVSIQKSMFNSKLGQKASGGKGFWAATMKANNASIAKADGNKPKPSQDMNLNRAGGPKSSSGGSNKPMNANRPSSAPKANTSGLSGKKPSDLLSKGGKVKKSVSEMTQQEIHEEYVQIQEFLGKIFKGVKNFVGGLFGGGQKQQQQQQQPKQQSMKDYKPADGLKLKGNMNDNRPKISNSSGSNQPFNDSGKPSGSKPSDIADIKSGTPEKVDKGLPNRKDKKKDKRFDEEVECTSDYIGPDERTKMKNEIILAKRAMRAANAAKAKAMSDNERILKSLGKFGKTTPEEGDK